MLSGLGVWAAVLCLQMPASLVAHSTASRTLVAAGEAFADLALLPPLSPLAVPRLR